MLPGAWEPGSEPGSYTSAAFPRLPKTASARPFSGFRMKCDRISHFTRFDPLNI
jgi:hypothetical protein